MNVAGIYSKSQINILLVKRKCGVDTHNENIVNHL